MGRRKKEIPDYLAYKKEIQIPQINTAPFDPRQSVDPDFSLSFFIRMVYSMPGGRRLFLIRKVFMKTGAWNEMQGRTPEILLKKLEQHIAGWLSNEETGTVNGRRTEILKHCLACGGLERGMFQLTVPTGGGKDNCISGLCLASRSGKRTGSRDLCDPLYKYY